jgi:hypothetical protein
VAYGSPVTVGGDWVALFQPPGALQTADGEPLVVNLAHSAKVLVIYTAMDYLQAAGDMATARYRYMLLIDGQSILPTVAPIECAAPSTGASLAVTAMPSLSAGRHLIQVVAQSSGGAVHITRNQALTVTCPLQ